MQLKFLNNLDLKKDLEDYKTIHEEIEKNVVFKGANLWILVFAIIIASVGLNINSTAVIIGAMLVAPLMGPINGMGYSLATYNFKLFRKSLNNYGFAVLASLLASTIYFALSPFSTAQSELLARISPTIYDVLIALFGGLAGIVAISTKYKGNVIPGVAIATALMPPLCTAGYGLATSQYNFFFGALYLFTINTVFIAISAVIISRILKFPLAAHVDPDRKKRVNRYITAIIIITTIPSIYFGYNLVQKENFTESAKRFSNEISVFEGAYLLKNEIDAQKKSIRLIYAGKSLTEESKNLIREKAKFFNLKEAVLVIDQGFAIDEKSTNENEILKNQLTAITLELKLKEKQIDSIANRPLLGKQILAEIKPLYPSIYSCSYSETFIFSDSISDQKEMEIVIFSILKNSLKDEDKQNINSWLKVKLQSDSVITHFVESNGNEK